MNPATESWAGFLLMILKAYRLCYVATQHKYIMDQYTLIINHEQKHVIAKALEKFSQMHLGQTHEEYEAAKKLANAFAKAVDNKYGNNINNLTS